MKIAATATSLLLALTFVFSPIISFGQEPDTLSKIAAIPIRITRLPLKKDYLAPQSLVLPVMFIDYGFASLRNSGLRKLNSKISEEVTDDASGFRTTIDDYLKYAPAASVYLLNFAGVKGRHRILDRTVILAMTTVLANQVVTSLKHGTHQLRPDGSTYNSFPSGHTTTAFIGAEMMNQELGWRSPWYSVAGYSMATVTGLLRIMNNRHWLSDVIAGAGIGMLTTKFTYWIYSKWENRKRTKPILLY